MIRAETHVSGPRSKIAASDHIALALSRAIHEHRIAPGTKLGEDDLALIYGVSRTIIRTALQSLLHGQLVEIKRFRGAFVARPTADEALDVFEARELLEPHTARSAAQNATAQDIRDLQDHIEKEHDALSKNDRGLALYLSGQLHVHIARIAAQPTIESFIETLIARSSLIVALYWKRESALCESDAHHALVRAIGHNDQAEAERLMRLHLFDLRSSLELDKPAVPTASLKEILG